MNKRRSCLTGLGYLAFAMGWSVAGIQAQTTLPAANSLPVTAADTSKPGFLWRVHQVGSSQATTLVRTEAQLSGLIGANIADPNAQGAASAPAAAPSPETAPIEFVVPGLINFDQNGGSNGNFTPDEQMPGIPGTGTGTDNIAAEVLTWLQLPAGAVTMGVNSDDGFRLSIGGSNPKDPFATKVGEFDGGRGASDSIFTFTVPQAGLYAARLIYNEGGGGANIEWFSQAADGTKTLINDAGGIKAFRAVVGAAATATVSKILPGIGQTSVAPNAPIDLEITDGGTAIATSSIKLSVDGTEVAATTSKSGSVTKVKYTPSSLYAPSSKHTVSLTYTEAGAPKTVSWSFTVEGYAILTPNFKVTPDTSKPGFLWNVFANAGNTTTSNQRAEDALAGLLKDADGNLLPNTADRTAVGGAIAAAPAPSAANAPLRFEVSGVINFAQDGSDAGNQNGNFKPDLQMPGIPASDGTDGIAAEIVTYIELPAGVTTMGVNSDDGFKTTAGIPLDVFAAVPAGVFDAGRGAADTLFSVVVQEAGVYAFRTLWEEGGGGANIEWFTLKADGSKVLVNDTANGGVKAYRALQGGTLPYVKAVTPTIVPRQVNQPSTTVSLVIEDGTSPVDLNSITLKLDGKVVNTTKTRSGSSITVTYTPDSLRIPGDKVTGDLTFKDSTGNYTRNQTWSFYNLRNLVLGTPAVIENFDSYEDGSVPTGWVEKNFTDSRTAGLDLNDLNSDSYKGWVVVSRALLEGLKSRIFNVAPGQTLNGQAIDTLSEGGLLYAESDVRGGNQVQFITTKPFNLSSLTNVVMSMVSLYEQNQDSLGAVEYSVDGGNSWLPVVYFLDQVDGGGDIDLNPDGSVDAVSTFRSANADTAAWTDNGVAKGDNYGDGILAPITQALGPFVAPRINDNATIDKRLEVFRLAQAGGKSDVRLRFAQLGTGSWYFGVDNLAFYEGPAPAVVASEVKLAASISGGNVNVTWTGGTGPFLLQVKSSLSDALWVDLVTTSDRSVTLPLLGGNAFLRVQDGTTKTVKLFKATLTGAAQRPNAVDSPATGAGLVSINGTTATYVATFAGLRDVATNAHVHGPAAADATAGVMFDLLGTRGATSGVLIGVATLNATQVSAIEAGNTYINVHSRLFPAGEIRGQLRP